MQRLGRAEPARFPQHLKRIRCDYLNLKSYISIILKDESHNENFYWVIWYHLFLNYWKGRSPYRRPAPALQQYKN